MHYHWGFGIGHVYSHGNLPTTARTSDTRTPEPELEPEPEPEPGPIAMVVDREDDSDTEHPELGLQNNSEDDLGESELEQPEGLADGDTDSGDELLAMIDLYG